jgi:hypothetical protein
VWRIHAEASLPDGVTFAREAVLRPSADPQRPLIALAWLEPRLRAAPAEAAAPSTVAAPATTTRGAGSAVPSLR